MDRLEAITARMSVEQDEVLLTVGGVVRVVDVQHDAGRHAAKACAKQVDHFERHAGKGSPGRRVFQTR
jgi:hypothetical protein